jgi:hypothetical protein
MQRMVTDDIEAGPITFASVIGFVRRREEQNRRAPRDKGVV